MGKPVHFCPPPVIKRVDERPRGAEGCVESNTAGASSVNFSTRGQARTHTHTYIAVFSKV